MTASSLILPAAIEIPNCGNCLYHEATPDLAAVMCKGVPPTPVVLGAQQTATGMHMQVENIWPQLPRASKGCALWKRKASVQ